MNTEEQKRSEIYIWNLDNCQILIYNKTYQYLCSTLNSTGFWPMQRFFNYREGEIMYSNVYKGIHLTFEE